MSREIVQAAVTDQPGARCVEISDATGLAYGIAWGFLQSLMADGLVSYETGKHGAKYWYTVKEEPYRIERTLHRVREIPSIFAV